MALWTALGLEPRTCGLTALVGGGGKTTALYALAHEAAQAGLSVVVTTTTHIRPHPWLPLTGDPAALPRLLAEHRVATFGVLAPGDKLSCPLPPQDLYGLADMVLVEADGSRGLPLKVPADHEPVIPPNADAVVALAGLDALGKPFSVCCHRPERAAALLGTSPETLVTPAHMAALFSSAQGGRKGVPAGAEFRCLLNKADTPVLRGEGEKIRELLAAAGLKAALWSFPPKERGGACWF